MRRVFETILIIDLYSVIYSQHSRTGKSRKKGGILLANLLQRSRTAFSRVSFSSFFAFKEGMYDTQIAALLSSPTVSVGFVRQWWRRCGGKCTVAPSCRAAASSNGAKSVKRRVFPLRCRTPSTVVRFSRRDRAAARRPYGVTITVGFHTAAAAHPRRSI